ncbi:MAG: acetate kinase, partial [Bacteroidaceae bacterium]|nr:acetate kinase [Bacteroidaceae bacterium]
MSGEVVLAKGLVERIGLAGSNLKHYSNGKDSFEAVLPIKDHNDAIKLIIDTLLNPNYGVIKSINEIYAVGHRVVHGGEYFSESVMINDKVKKVIEDCSDLAPLHNPANLIGIKACETIMPEILQVAVFDTAFHQTMPEKAFLYAIPYELYKKYGIRKYGFHGISHKYVSQKAAEIMGKPYSSLKIVTCHLGNGSSVCAVDGR